MSIGLEQSLIAEMVERGASFEEVEQDVIDVSPVDPDEKAALWLFTWSSLSRAGSRATQ
jgi:hypothetical protein